MARVLIAEDEEPVRQLLARALAMDGHEVEAAPDGAAALERLAEAPFDLLLTDIRMPIMDGIALALTAARDYPALSIVLMTGYAGERERAKGLDALVHDVVLKPFTLTEIKQALRAALANRPPQPAAF
ncbi:MAG: response regulator [Bradyrhizobiaceae bacterium]|nr:response regulator [Bradyrhizobiaceae bacterium]